LIVQDSSFHIRSLNGFPGAYIKYILKTIGLEGILKLLDGVEDRSAYAEGALTYIEDEKHFWTFTNQSSDSTIALEIREGIHEESWSELWKILIPNGFNKTYSELTKEEYDAKQKSGKSTSEFRQFAEWLEERD
jgi:non-canonical purine NTP pyrophosphatase (RdgB/HAM1 family)